MAAQGVPCPVCQAPDRRCLGVDLLPLPGPHVDPAEPSPIYDALALQVAS